MTEFMLKIVLFAVIGTTMVGLLTGEHALPEQQGDYGRLGETKEIEATPEEDEDLPFQGFIDVAACVSPLGLFFGQGFTCDLIEEPLRDALSGTEVGKIILTVTDGLSTFITNLLSLISFNIPGAPPEAQAIVGIPLTTATIYLIIRLVKGGG